MTSGFVCVCVAAQIPKANIVGKPGDAVLHMMRNLELERLALAGMALGIARRCIEVCGTHAGDVAGIMMMKLAASRR